ncbi:MAG: hypothetical protein ACFB9M_02260 [Myxococcota bacterium]
MSLSVELRARLTRERLSSLLAPTYARLRNTTPNQGFEALYAAFGRTELLVQHQQALSRALREARPHDDEAQLVARLDKKGARNRRFQAATASAREEGALIAWALSVDGAGGRASGEALALLETEEGRSLAARGCARVCSFGARELLR